MGGPSENVAEQRLEVRVDLNKCVGSTLCVQIAPEVFALDENRQSKVEHPDGGDASRSWGPRGDDGTSPVYVAFNRAKRSVTVDMTDAEQVASLKDFILRRPDPNYKPGVERR